MKPMLHRIILLGICGGLPACSTLHDWGILGSPTAVRVTENDSASNGPVLPPEAHRFPLAQEQSVVGQLMSLQLWEGDTLPDVARHYGLGYEELTSANPAIDPWVPAKGANTLIPVQFVLPRAPRRGIVINLAAMRLFHFPAAANGTELATYPVGIGKEGRATPTGPLSILRKKEHPTWYPTANIRADHSRKGDPLPAAVSPGPDNPLGDFALYLSLQPYLIHGTNKPYSIGWRASNGCIRLYPENIAQLFPAVPLKEPVLIVNQPYLVGWRDGRVYLQAHRPHEELNAKDLQKRLRAELKKLESSHHHALDWAKVDRVLGESRGIPIPISAAAPSVDTILARARPLAHPKRFLGQPEDPAQDQDGWRILVDDSVSESTARRLTAFLNHQGPQIPARTEAKRERYQVIAGPYPTAKAARSAVKRLRIELELEGQVLPPESEVDVVAKTRGGTAPRTAKPKQPASVARPEPASERSGLPTSGGASRPPNTCGLGQSTPRHC